MDEVNNETKATKGKMDIDVQFEEGDVKVDTGVNFEGNCSTAYSYLNNEPTLGDVVAGIKKVDEMFPFLGEYEFNREIAMLSSDLQTSATAMLSAGCRILRLKEHEPHGKFMKAVEDVGLGYKTAKRFMSCALRFIEADTGKVKYPQLVQQSSTKIYDLVILDDDDLKALEEGSSVSNITLDDVDKLTTRELRKKLREAKEEKKALESVINSKNEKLDEMEKALHMGKKPVEYPDVKELNVNIDKLSVDSFSLVQKIKGIADEFNELTTGDETADGAYRIAFEKLKSTARAILEEMERAVDYTDSVVPECIRMNTGFGLIDAGIQEADIL